MSEVTITVDDDHLASIDEVVAAVRATGVEVTGVHAAIGVISGTVSASIMSAGARHALTGIRGVGAIEESSTLGVAPPDSSIQ